MPTEKQTAALNVSSMDIFDFSPDWLQLQLAVAHMGHVPVVPRQTSTKLVQAVWSSRNEPVGYRNPFFKEKWSPWENKRIYFFSWLAKCWTAHNVAHISLLYRHSLGYALKKHPIDEPRHLCTLLRPAAQRWRPAKVLLTATLVNRERPNSDSNKPFLRMVVNKTKHVNQNTLLHCGEILRKVTPQQFRGFMIENYTCQPD